MSTASATEPSLIASKNSSQWAPCTIPSAISAARRPPGRRSIGTPQHEGRQRKRGAGEREPEKRQRFRAEVDGGDEDCDQAPGGRETRESEVPAHRPVLHSVGSLDADEVEARATTVFVARQRPSRNGSSSDPSTL